MKAMRSILEDYLANSTPEQLRAELTKGNRPYFQTLEDPEWICANEPALPAAIPATVSFFEGMFATEASAYLTWARSEPACIKGEVALAA